MPFLGFGYAGSAARSAALAAQARNISPVVDGLTVANHNIGSIGLSQIAQLKVLGASKSFIWGSHPWGSKKYKVAK